MPLNKNAIIRYQTLDRCFSDFRHRYFMEDLIEACSEAIYDFSGSNGVSRRQIFDDIAFMESPQGWDIPLERFKEGKRVYYRYEDKTFSINKKELTDEELNQLKVTILTLSKYRGLPSTAWLEDVITNLECHFGLKGDTTSFIEFDQNRFLKGINFLSLVIDATLNHQCLDIVYQSYKGEIQKWNLHPYFIKQYNNRWFLLGLNENYNSISNIALDRIISLDVSDRPFIENKIFDPEKYFTNIIGVTLPLEHDPEDIVLKFDSQRYPYVISKPLHASQYIVDDSERKICIHVCINKELEATILSFGPQVEVISPQSLRDQIKEKIKKYSKIYF